MKYALILERSNAMTRRNQPEAGSVACHRFRKIWNHQA